MLGETREEIAAEKLAVVQEGTIAVLPDEEFAAPRRPERRASAAPAKRPPPSSAAAIEREVEVTLPGRLERRGDEVRDGAHNADGARWLVAQLDRDDYTIVASILRDKDARRDALGARDEGAPLRRDAVVERPRALGGRARAPRRRRTSRRSRSSRIRPPRSPVRASTRPSSSPARCTFLPTWR